MNPICCVSTLNLSLCHQESNSVFHLTIFPPTWTTPSATTNSSPNSNPSFPHTAFTMVGAPQSPPAVHAHIPIRFHLPNPTQPTRTTTITKFQLFMYTSPTPKQRILCHKKLHIAHTLLNSLSLCSGLCFRNRI